MIENVFHNSGDFCFHHLSQFQVMARKSAASGNKKAAPVSSMLTGAALNPPGIAALALTSLPHNIASEPVRIITPDIPVLQEQLQSWTHISIATLDKAATISCG
ncbi:MAG: hypothetical protein HZC44_10290 [Geobacter sp.]|nr:hypothetical protein [Geobacter sp.]